MSVHRDLSLLLDGALPPDEAQALRARIASEPDVAAAWASLQQTTKDLARLPDIPPPPGLNARILQGPAPRVRWQAPLFAAAAAACLAVWATHTPDPTVVLLDGQQWLDGEQTVLAGDVRVEVAGRAHIRVEPAPGGVREMEGLITEGPMNQTAILTALGGSLVTIAVYEGRAALYPPDSAPISLRAGESHTSGTPHAAAPPKRTPTQAGLTARSATELEEALHAAEALIEELELQNAINRGQLQAFHGETAVWPEDVTDAFTEGALEDAFTDALTEYEDASLVRLDCDEYPCMVILQSHDPVDGWEKDLQEHLASFQEGLPPASISINVSNYRHDDYTEGYMIIAAGDKDSIVDNVKLRLDYRMNEVVKELGEHVEENAQENQPPEE